MSSKKFFSVYKKNGGKTVPIGCAALSLFCDKMFSPTGLMGDRLKPGSILSVHCLTRCITCQCHVHIYFIGGARIFIFHFSLHQGFQLVMFTFDALGVVNIRHRLLFSFATQGQFQDQFILMFIQKNIIAFLFYLCALT